MNLTHLHSGFLRSAEAWPDRAALHVDGTVVSYASLLDRAARIAAMVQSVSDPCATPLTAVFADRSATGFAGILGALLAGHGYVPLNVRFPSSRTHSMLRKAGCATLVADAAASAHLNDLMRGVDRSLCVVMPDAEDVRGLRARWPQHQFIGAGELQHASRWDAPNVERSSVAYLLFTSGSTGEPKGVAITHANITHFLDVAADRYQFTPDDRFSQTFDTTFDLSVFDLFAAWQAGACVYCPPAATMLNPDRFIRDHALTVWFSVPTVASLMKRFGALQAGRYPSLRWSLFCGEPLRADLVRAWATAAPTSVVENLYGPTELTVACTIYRWNADGPAEDDALVPIGLPNPGMDARVVDESLNEVAPGAVGELVMAGPQRTPGYWADEDATRRSFVTLPSNTDVFYRTGDRVRRPIDGGPLSYVGRRDEQVKVRGHRIELGEVETALRQEPGVQEAVAVAWPLTEAGAEGIAAFLTGTDLDTDAIRRRLRDRLQAVAVPHTIRVVATLPQNANGKIDRTALTVMLA